MMIFRNNLVEEIEDINEEVITLRKQVNALIEASKEWKKTTAKVNIMADMNNLEFVEMERHLHVQRKEPKDGGN